MARTESIVRYDRKPVLRDPILIESLPGIGNVGKIAGDFVADALKAERFARIYSMNFPAQVVPDDDGVVKMAGNELWNAKLPDGRDVVFLRGNAQASTPEGQFIVAQDVMEIMESYGVSRVITLGGLGTGNMVEDPKVLAAVSDKGLRKELEKAGAVFVPGEPKAGIVGAAGLLVGMSQIDGIEAFCLMGETSGYFEDHKSAMCVVKVLAKILGLKRLNMKELREKSHQIEEFTAQVKEGMENEQTDDLSYIG